MAGSGWFCDSPVFARKHRKADAILLADAEPTMDWRLPILDLSNAQVLYSPRSAAWSLMQPRDYLLSSDQKGGEQASRMKRKACC